MKALLVLPGVDACILGLSLAVSTHDGAAPSSPTLVRHLHARTTSYVEIDNDKKGLSAGDLLTFTHALTENGKRVGSTDGYCIRVLRRTSHCTMTTFLSDGQIEAAGPLAESSGSRLAVTGGAGAYERARGSLIVRRTGFFQFELSYRLSS